MTALDVLLDLRLDIAHTRLDLASGLLGLAFDLQLVVADDMAGDLLHFAFGLFVPTLDLFFVHVSVLLMNCAATPARKRISHRWGKIALWIDGGRFGNAHSKRGRTQRTQRFL